MPAFGSLLGMWRHLAATAGGVAKAAGVLTQDGTTTSLTVFLTLLIGQILREFSI